MATACCRCWSAHGRLAISSNPREEHNLVPTPRAVSLVHLHELSPINLMEHERTWAPVQQLLALPLRAALPCAAALRGGDK